MKLTGLYVPPLRKQPIVEVMRRAVEPFNLFRRILVKEYTGFPLETFEQAEFWQDLLEEEARKLANRYGTPFVCFVPLEELFGYYGKRGSFVFTGGNDFDPKHVAYLGAYFTARILGLEDHTDHAGLDCLIKEENLDGPMKLCAHCRKSQGNYVVKE